MTGSRRRQRRGLRSAVVLLVMALAGVAAGRVVVLVLDGRAAPTSSTASAGPSPAVSSTVVRTSVTGSVSAVPARAARGVRVLHAWDAARAAAYARGDRDALRRLYAPGSRAGRRDVQVLEAYVDRGLVVRGLRTQVLAVRVRAQEDRRVVLQVTDRVVGGRAVVHGRPAGRGVSLPYDEPSTRVVSLERSAARWRVVSVRDG